MKRLLLHILLVGAFVITAPACSSTENEAKPNDTAARAVRKKRAPAKKRAEKAQVKQKISEPEQPPAEQYSYTSAGKPDPFMPLFAEEPASTAKTAPRKSSKPLTPLQKYDLKELSLVAVVVKSQEAAALLEDPSGYGYIVRKGMLIGKNDGIIKKVINDGIIIEEQIYNSMGELETKISTLTIQHDE